MRFKVRLSGRGISMPSEGSADPVIGFFTTRWVTARDAAEATSAAIEVVLSEWRPGGEYAIGGVPDIEVEAVTALGWWGRLASRSPGGGYSFYCFED
jgi:hypothetical protein